MLCIYKLFFIPGIEQDQDGGAISINTHSYVDITDCMFSHNEAADDGGAIHIEIENEIKMSDSHFIQNVADDSGASVVIESSNVLIDSCIFQSESVSVGYGGSLSILDGSTVYVVNSEFANCEAHIGGSISVINLSELTIKDSNILKSIGNESAGAMHVGYRSKLTAINVSIQNSMSELGGGIHCTEGGYFTAHKCNVTSNRASSSHGGGLYLDDCKVTLTNSLFYGNIAEERGGAIYAHSASMHLDRITGIENVAGKNGGFILLTSNSDLHSNNLDMCDNVAQFNTSIAVFRKSVVTLGFATFYTARNVSRCLIMVNDSSKVVLDYKATTGATGKSMETRNGRFKEPISRANVCEDNSSEVKGTLQN